jgi:hypothetical protein
MLEWYIQEENASSFSNIFHVETFAAVLEALSNVYSDEEVLNKTIQMSTFKLECTVAVGLCFKR